MTRSNASPSRRGLPALATLAVLAAACGADWQPAFSETAAAQRFDSVDIAPPDEALTFARLGDGVARRVIAVTEYRDGTVHGIDLAAALGGPVRDPIAVLDALGYDGVRALLAAPPSAALVAVPAADLELPLDLRAHHIAAATNFPEHADDAGTAQPFLFAKLVEPTGPRAAVPAGAALLDYEAEFAWVTLTPLAAGDDATRLGLVLCNDFTDRATLMRRIDPWDIESGAGFATGKSFPGYLPIGDLFVVPRDPRRFAAGLELRLYVNGALRQRAPATEMIWDLDEILAHTWAWKDRRWEHRGSPVGLLADPQQIPARTLLLSGTPHGTVFDGLRTRHYLAGVTAWLLGGWSERLPAHVVAAYIEDARAAGVYLRPGDRVEMHVDRLGVLRNRVTP